jgi:endonuclease/exonuclease/phosphatase family metal-dependent hydrolase
MKVSMVKIIILATASVLLLAAILLLVWRNHYINYTDSKGHLLKGSYADSSNVFDGTLGVVTWNLHFGEKLDEIISTLENSSELQEKELLLLQEINAEGVEKIASSLHYNYIYYPTVYSHKREKEYGLAILSVWPLEDAERILLPNWLPGWVENRFVIKAVTSMNGRESL